MRAKTKRLFKRLLKTGMLFTLVGMGVLIGFAIGAESASDPVLVHIYPDDPQVHEETFEFAEERFEEHVAERIVMPDIPQIPNHPTRIYIDRSPSFFDVVNGIGTIFASLGLIGLGMVMLMRHRRQPKEKSPESLK